ncbi:ABC transporter permease [Paenibacillus radicis (ex Xue et al. 2023)]|uniref:ABC transporter permease n=1 Tax=Paenibacillus radicis (ex Xue et al. 2023) TaxID=2972489 RepID=A0ABT1YGN0_9BACL|nr:ABC transporter permease [Paenibacillus radicis (ex Xue et al. 2023)]MCR8631880.1 ABC transporter permease [Paenibacillus radicis (ex Xue et al. 2023)]
MRQFLLKSIIQVIPVLFMISIIVFLLVHVSGDPVSLMLPDTATDEDRRTLSIALGLDQPLISQYFSFLGNLLQGDFGKSFRYNEPALPIVLARLPATFELAFFAMVVATVIAIPLGIISATKRNSFWDVLATGAAVLGKAMPHFWLGIMFILLFSVKLGIFPVSGRGTFAHLILPAFTLGTGIAAEMTRLIRSSMLEILGQDYIRTARSKGLGEKIVIYKHAFRNSLIPVVTIMALQISSLISGALITEAIFAWPGMGQLIVQAVNTRDMAIVQAAVFVIAILVIASNMLADLVYRLLDPRIKFN